MSDALDWDMEVISDPKDLSFQYASFEIQKSLRTEWMNVKKLLPKEDVELQKAVKSFESILNYFYEL